MCGCDDPIYFLCMKKNDVQASINVKMDVQYGQTNAREMEKMMNTFRTGKNAWAWTSNGKKKTYSNLKKVRYDYWVQEFSSKIGSSKETKAKDFKTQVRIEISDKKIQKQNISVNKKQCEMFCGDLITLPVISSKIYVEDHWPQDYISVSEDDAWDIENENIAEIQEKRLFGKKEGKTKILANAFGKNISVPITVHSAMKPAKSIQLSANVVYSTTNFIYNGQVQKPKVKEIVVKEGDRVLSNSKDYTYSLSDSKKPGVYGVKVQQNGEHGEAVQSIQSYQIRPKERNLEIDAEKKGFHLKWNRDSLIAGYQICYSTKKT